MKENYEICHCMQVSYADIEDAMQNCKNLKDVEAAFEKVQNATNCTTGCGGCYNRVREVISELMN